MKVSVCIGSSCHKKGSYHVIKRLAELIEDHNLGDQVTISSAFCLGHCSEGISVAIDGDVITGVGMGNVDDLFEQYILNPEE
jgi:NADH:ubiquinone oxidoreductase subunit E